MSLTCVFIKVNGFVPLHGINIRSQQFNIYHVLPVKTAAFNKLSRMLNCGQLPTVKFLHPGRCGCQHLADAFVSEQLCIIGGLSKSLLLRHGQIMTTNITSSLMRERVREHKRPLSHTWACVTSMGNRLMQGIAHVFNTHTSIHSP